MKSTTGKSPCILQLFGYNILSSHLKDAFIYDVETNPIATFKFLTTEHFEPNSAGKILNYLADDVLGKRMLEVLQVTGEYPYQMRWRMSASVFTI